MNEKGKQGNTGIAPLSNLSIVSAVLGKMSKRVNGLPGIGVLYGPPGRGKTYACVTVANQQRGYYVQVRSAWNRKTLLEKVLFEMGIAPSPTISQMLDQVCEQMALSQRPLIVDEFDFCLRNAGMIELIRDIYEGSQGTLLLVGEERIPQKLKKWERFHSRVLSWIPALPVSVDDARKLAPIYCPDIKVADDLLAHIVSIAHGSVRRVSVNLTVVRDIARREAHSTMSLKDIGDSKLYTGDAPAGRE